MRLTLSLLLIVTIEVIFMSPRAARACGGGVVSAQPGSIGADAQRIIISARDGSTDVITQIGVPATTADYGVLLPLPSEPTLDATPVASADIDRLEKATAPTIIRADNNEGGIPVLDCSCGGASKGGANVGGDSGVRVTQPVTIGPVSAVVLTADTGDAINAWLSDNGFAIAATDQPLVADYAGPGRYFIAIRRSDTAATNAPSSVGVHFTLAGDQRAFPMRFARLGAAPTVAFTVFVAAYTVAAPGDPFAALTINDLDRGTLNTTGYADAVSKAVGAHGNHAFVLEGSWSATSLSTTLGALSPFINARQTVTRMSTRVPSTALDADVAFDEIYSGAVPNQRTAQRIPGRHPRVAFAFAAFALAAVVRRRPRR